jgi:hypothetical protein
MPPVAVRVTGVSVIFCPVKNGPNVRLVEIERGAPDALKTCRAKAITNAIKDEKYLGELI